MCGRSTRRSCVRANALGRPVYLIPQLIEATVQAVDVSVRDLVAIQRMDDQIDEAAIPPQPLANRPAPDGPSVRRVAVRCRSHSNPEVSPVLAEHAAGFVNEREEPFQLAVVG